MPARPTPRRTGALLTSAALALAGVALAPSPTAGAIDPTPGYSVRHLSVQVSVGPDGDQPCRVTADLYRPDGVSARRPAPAILTTHGFGGAKDNGQQRAIGRGFAQEGYVVLSYSGLGFGGSGCKIHLDDPDWDGKAGSQLVDVLAGGRTVTFDNGRHRRVRVVAREPGRPQDPRVGMIGGSYGGQVQYAVAMQDRRVDALIPIITWHDLAYSLAPNNTALHGGVSSRVPGVHKRQWTGLFFGAGVADGFDDPQNDPARNAGCPNFADQVCRAAAQLFAQGHPDADTLALARHASVASYADRVHAPTLVVGGQNDTLFNLQESVATFRALRRAGTEARLVWQSWGHSGSTPAAGELDLGGASLRDSYLGRRFLAWMDRHVRGDRSVDPGPRFEFFRDWVDYDSSPGAAGQAVARAFAQRPRLGLRPDETLFLSGSDQLVAERAEAEQGSASYTSAPGAPTSYSETSALEGNGVTQPPRDAVGTSVAFTSAPLAAPADVVGSPRLLLHLDAPVASQSQAAGPGGRLVLFAKLYDVAPDGSATLRNRLISPVRVADVDRPVRVELPGVVHRFETGHRLRLVVAASDAAYANNAVAQPVTIRTGPQRPGTLRLPLAGGLRLRSGDS